MGIAFIQRLLLSLSSSQVRDIVSHTQRDRVCLTYTTFNVSSLALPHGVLHVLVTRILSYTTAGSTGISRAAGGARRIGRAGSSHLGRFLPGARVGGLTGDHPDCTTAPEGMCSRPSRQPSALSDDYPDAGDKQLQA